MAVTKLLRIKESGGSNPAAHLKRNISYICNDEKTENGIWIGGNAGQTPEEVYNTMTENKKLWGKLGGSQAFHYTLSFHPDTPVDEKLAYQIAEEFCQELLADQYYYVFAVHNDKAHMHVHITFDSVSKIDGKKFHSPKGDWQRRIQPITDRLCEKYNLPTLDYEPDRRGMNYGEWKKTNQMDGKDIFTWNDIIRDDIDEAIRISGTYEAFLTYLKKDGYTVSRDGQVLSLKPEGKERAVRTGRLGKGYAKEEIIGRIADQKLQPGIEKRYRTYGNRQEMREIIYMKIKRSPGWQMTPMQKNFWKRWNNTYFIRKPERMTQEQRIRRKQDILEVRSLSNAIGYMVDHDIGEAADLNLRKETLQKEETALSHDLSVCMTRYYKKQPFYLVSRYEKQQKEYCIDPSLEKKEALDQLMEQIENVCPYEAAVSEREELKEKMDGIRAVMKDNRKEQRILDDIGRMLYDQEPETLKTERQPDKDRGKTERRIDKDRVKRTPGKHYKEREPVEQKSETERRGNRNGTESESREKGERSGRNDNV